MKRIWYPLVLCLILSCLVLPVGAATEQESDEIMTMPPGYTALPDSLPEELTPLLPDGLFSSDPEEALDAVQEGVSLSGLLSILLDALGLRLSDAARLLATLVGLLLLSALLGRLSETVGGRTGELCGFVLRLALAAATVSLTVGVANTVSLFFTQLCSLCAGMMPVMGTLYVLGGSLSQAAVNEGLLLAFLNLMEYLCASLTPTVCGVCMALSLLGALGLRHRLEALGAWVRKTYVGFLGLLTFLLSVTLGCQSVLSARADSLRMKGLKYAVGSLVPVAGGTISGALGTVAAGVELLRSVCGVCGVLLLALLLLPVLIELLLFRQVIRLAAVAAAALDCPADARLLEDIAELYGYMAAAVSLCSVFFVLALGVLIAAGSQI